jgi:hypothetical protein
MPASRTNGAGGVPQSFSHPDLREFAFVSIIIRPPSKKVKAYRKKFGIV